MSKKPSRRKKAQPAKMARKTFTITVEGQPMVVSYEPRWLKSGYAHFVFQSPHKPPRRIPLSETGYRSHFVSMEDVKEARSPQDFARDLASAWLRSKQSRPEDPRQLALFQ
jgi:hypothetical protein